MLLVVVFLVAIDFSCLDLFETYTKNKYISTHSNRKIKD